MMVTCEVVNQLKAARKQIKHSWTKGRLNDSFGKVCALGALGVTGCKDNGHYNIDHCQTAAELLTEYIPQEAKQRLIKYVAETYPGGKGDKFLTPANFIPSFNDHEKTTQQDVLDVFDRAIVAAIEQVEQENG